MFFKILLIVDVFNKSGFSLIKSINSVLLIHFKYLSIYVSPVFSLGAIAGIAALAFAGYKYTNVVEDKNIVELLLNNTANIESNLFNIRQFDLTKPKQEFKPSLNQIGEQTFFSKNNVFVPEPLVIQKNQRPVGPFSG